MTKRLEARAGGFVFFDYRPADCSWLNSALFFSCNDRMAKAGGKMVHIHVGRIVSIKSNLKSA